MQTVFNAIKNYLISKPKYFEAEGLPALTEKDFYFGVADLLKNKNSLIVAIVPQTEIDIEGDIVDYLKQSEIIVSFICRNNRQSILNDNVAKYARAFRKTMLEDCLMNDAVDNSELGQRQYYFDAGTVEMQMSAVECNMTVTTHDTLD